MGRLAACFLDSLATMGLPGFGYGINYEYGLFRQEIRNGQQVEKPDNWRTYDSPWQIRRPQDAVLVSMYGHVEHTMDRQGCYNPMWLDWKVVIGVPSDMLVVGYGGRTVNCLRLSSARASQEFDMRIFNEGDYLNAVEQKVQLETISKVLYPTDSVAAGRTQTGSGIFPCCLCCARYRTALPAGPFGIRSIRRQGRNSVQ